MSRFLPLSLATRRPGRIRPQLDALQEVLAELGDPQERFRSILVVGTNGKGSTAAMAESVLATHGLQTALYTSPHLERVDERIRIRGQTLAPDDLDRQLAILDRFPELTFFETLTAAAFLAFAEAEVDCAVLEAGMGGRWDATRAASSAIAGVTNVGSDHADWLGGKMEDRAADKGAALAAAQLSVISSQIGLEVERCLGATSAMRADDLVWVEDSGSREVEVGWNEDSLKIRLSLDGAHQIHNLQLALALVRCAHRLGWIDRLEPAAVLAGLENVRWPGRLSTHRVAGRRVLVDCAHNAEAVNALARHLDCQPTLYHLLFSCLGDKPVEAMADALRPHVGNVVVCPIDDERAMPEGRLRAAFPEAEWAPSVMDAFDLLPAPVVAAGSIRLVGELLRHTDGRTAE